MRARLAEDLDRLMAVMNAAFDPVWGEAWSRRQVEDSLLTGRCAYFLINENGAQAAEREPAAGFILTRLIAGETELLLLAVDPRWRRRGLGTLLLHRLASDARANGASRLFLEMRRGNPAESLYRNFGFAQVGERPNYYRTSTGERIDAVTFAMSI